MSRLTNPVTGHEVNTDEESVKFWEAAGYRQAEQEKPARKGAARKSAPKKSEK